MEMKVVKFGGSSLADANQFRRVAAIVTADPARRYVVASAPGKRFKDDAVGPRSRWVLGGQVHTCLVSSPVASSSPGRETTSCTSRGCSEGSGVGWVLCVGA